MSTPEPGIAKRTLRAGDVRLEALEAIPTQEQEASHSGQVGEGAGSLLILHGFCGAKESFEEQMVELARQGWHVVVPDQRGHGSSDHPVGEGAYSFSRFVEDALALADELDWQRFVLLGHSMGGMTAQRFALDHPQRLEGLVLMDTSCRGPEIDPALAEAGRTIVETSGMEGLVEALRELGGGPLVTEAHARLLTERPGYEDELEAQTLASSAGMWLAMSAEMFGARDLLDDLRALRLPTLVMVGEQDAPFMEASRLMSEAIPDARLSLVADAGHSPQLEAPEAWLEALTEFLGKLRHLPS